MSPFGWGVAFGWLTALLVSGVVAYVAYGRYERLQRRARQAERLAELGTLTGGLAHEIKNPLSTVQLNLQLLREDLPSDDPAYSRLVNRLATVQRETARLRDTLDDFLRYAGKIELEKKPVNVHALLEELGDFFTPQAQFHRVQLRVERPTEKLLVRLDERLIKQAVLNLLINALQAMPEQGGEIILSATRDGRHARLTVRDTGRGIEPAALEQIFNAYYSTKRGGTGLGLAIAQRIAEEHGGHISATSEIGKGSAFTIDVPL